MISVFLRNRKNYGAQITCLPFLFAIKKKDMNCELRVIYKENLDYFYNQFNWIDKKIKSTSTLSDLKLINRKKHCISLRPNSLALRLSFFIKGAYPREAIIKVSKKKKSYLLNKQIFFNENIYRGIQYLELSNNDINPEYLAKKLSLPFEHEAKNSTLELSNDANRINILIMVGGGAGEFKKWGVHNFLQACSEIEQQLNRKVTVHSLIGPDESEEKIQLLNAININPFIKIYEKISIADISKLALHCDITIANDCGPSHVAQCTQNGFVGIFDKKKPEWFYQNKLSKCLYPLKKKPISEIKVQEVVTASIKIIQDKNRI